MKRAQYICIEGTEGVGKTTQTKMLVEYLRNKGYRVLETKEPGSSHSPLTMTLRGIMLDNQYDKQLTMAAREFISQAIRSIHLEKVVIPGLSEYDFIIQDRGILSGLAYGTGCGNNEEMLTSLATYVIDTAGFIPNSDGGVYDNVVYLTGSVSDGIKRALTSKQEFETGDAMESRGNTFLDEVSGNMKRMSELFSGVCEVSVDGKNKDEVFAEILAALRLA